MAQQVDVRRDFASTLTTEQIKQLRRETRKENWGRAWYKFSRNPLSIIGGATVLLVVLVAIFASVIAPYPEHAKPFVDFDNASQPPSGEHLFGTDEIGRDILSRVMFGYRFSLTMAVVVLSLVTPTGVLLGLVAAAGCTTMVKSPAEVKSTYRQALDTDLRQMAEDWNVLWLADRQYRLTRWYTR